MGKMDSAHVFTVTVDGNDVSAYLLQDTFKCTSALAHEIDTCNFTVEDQDGNLPDCELWKEVIVTDEGATRLFAGYCTRLKIEIAPSMATKRIQLFCQDYGVLLKTVVVYAAYYDQTDEAILDALFTTYLPEITTVGITATVGVHSFVFDNVTLLDAVQQIAERTRAQWYVDYSKDFHYWGGTTPSSASFGLSDAATADYAATFPWQRNSLSFSDDGEGIVNQVIVQGGVSASAPTCESFSGNGTKAEFFVANTPIRDIVRITVDGVYQTWATDFAVDDWTDVDGNIVDCLVNYHRGRVRWDAFKAPAAGVNNVVICYTYDTSVSVTLSSAASIATYGRTFTRKIVNRDISTVEEATAFAQAYLAEHAIRRRTGRCVVEKYGLSSGETMDVTCSVLGLDGDRGYGEDGYGEDGYGGDDYLLQSVTTAYSNKGVQHTLEFGEFQPSLSNMLSAMAKGYISTGGIPPGGGGGYSGALGVVGRPTPMGTNITREADIFYAGRFEAVDIRGSFDWDAYGSVTGIILGLDTTQTPHAGILLGLDSGTVKYAAGDLNGHYGYSSSTFGVCMGEYSTDDYITIDSTNGIRFFDSGDTLRAQLTSGEWTLGDTSNEHVKVTATALQIKDGATVHSKLSGGTFWTGDSSTTERLQWDATNGLRIFNANNAAVMKFDTTGNAQIVGGITVPAGGYIQVGSGTKDADLDGFIMDDGELVGQENGVDMVYLSSTDGKLYAGAGNVWLDEEGVNLDGSQAVVPLDSRINWWDGTDLVGYAALWRSLNSSHLYFKVDSVAGNKHASIAFNAECAGGETTSLKLYTDDDNPAASSLIAMNVDGVTSLDCRKTYVEAVGMVGIDKTPASPLDINLSTEDLEIVDAGSAAATEQDWIEVEVGGNTGYIRVFAAK